MIILITGASHAGKTALAQKLLEKYKYPYLSIDHLKMGLIRSGNTELTPMDDNELTEYLWPIVREMIKTAIENKQNLIVEGCYIPFDWANDFTDDYLKNIKYYCLIMSERYIKNHFDDIKKYANVIENRLDDECTMETVLADNLEVLRLAKLHKVNYILIDNKYNINIAPCDKAYEKRDNLGKIFNIILSVLYASCSWILSVFGAMILSLDWLDTSISAIFTFLSAIIVLLTPVFCALGIVFSVKLRKKGKFTAASFIQFLPFGTFGLSVILFFISII